MLLTRQQLRAHVMASDDEERFSLCHVQIKPDGTTIATNGHIAVRVKPKNGPNEAQFPEIAGLEGTDPTEPVYLLAETAQAVEKVVPKESDLVSFARARLLVNGRVVIGATDLRTPHLIMASPIADALAGQFPDITKAFPKKKALLTITLNAEYLERIAKYAKAFVPGGPPKVTLTFYGPDDGVLFAWSDAEHDVDGCVMPMRA